MLELKNESRGTLTERFAYTPTEAAQLAHVSKPTLYRWMHIEGFPVIRIGRCTRIPADAFRAWLNNQVSIQEGLI